MSDSVAAAVSEVDVPVPVELDEEEEEPVSLAEDPNVVVEATAASNAITLMFSEAA